MELMDCAVDCEVWGEKLVTDLVGTELEWSTITFATRKMKFKVCTFCRATFTGGPNHIREHIDGRITPRHVSGHPPCTDLIALQVKPCRPTDEWEGRHADVLGALRLRQQASGVAAVLQAQRDSNKAKASAEKHRGGPDQGSPLLMRPSVEEVDEQWARALVKKGLAMDLVDDTEFRKAVLMTARAGLSYVNAQLADSKLPHRTCMSTVHVPDLDVKLSTKMTKRIDGLLAETGLCRAFVCSLIM